MLHLQHISIWTTYNSSPQNPQADSLTELENPLFTERQSFYGCKAMNIALTWLLFFRNWKNVSDRILVWVCTAAKPKTRILEMIPGKHLKGVVEQDREKKEGNTGYISKQVTAQATGLNSAG